MATTSNIKNNAGIGVREGLAIIIPVYNHAETVGEVVKSCLKTN